MFRTRTTFTLLQAIAAIAILAITMWSLGFSMFRFAEAANVTSFSDTLSDSAPLARANHTLSFVTASSGVQAGEAILITFPADFDDIELLDEDDIDVAVNGSDLTLAASASGTDWGVALSPTTIEISSDTGVIGANATVTIEIGTHATFGATGDSQIENPAVVDSYEITVDAGSVDTGSTRVAIIAPVTVTASVETSLDISIEGVAAGQNINGTTTTGATTPTEITFGQLSADVASTAAQQISVSTNASNGFVVTVQVDSQLVSATGADIDGFANGNFTSTPTAWVSPAGTIGQENTYGHWGITTNDNSVTAALTDEFDVDGSGNLYVSASTTPVEVMRHNGPADGLEPHVGQTQVGYQVEISPLQEAGDDYEATLTYVVTPIF